MQSERPHPMDAVSYLFNFTSAGLAILFLTQKWRMDRKTSFTVRASILNHNKKDIHKQCNDTKRFQDIQLESCTNGTKDCK